MHTKDMLAEALRGVGLDQMAAKAAAGYYHDYLSPIAMPEMALLNELAFAVANAKDQAARDKIMELRQRAINGDFDATTEESEEWAKS